MTNVNLNRFFIKFSYSYEKQVFQRLQHFYSLGWAKYRHDGLILQYGIYPHQGRSQWQRLKSLLKLSSHYFCTVLSAFLLSSLVCPVYAGRASVINVDLQAVPPASLSPFVTADGWNIKQAGAILPPPVAKQSPGTTSLHNCSEESSGSVSMVGLAFVQKVCQPLQALFDGQSPASVTLVAGMGGAGGGGDDDGDDYSHIEKFEREPQAEFFVWGSDSFTQLCLKQKQRLLKILRQKMQWAQTCGNRDLALILRDRIMLIEIDRDFLKQPTPCSNSSYQTQRYEWLLRDSQEIQHYDQAVNSGDWQTPGYSGRQAGSGGSGASGSGATSKPGGETGIGTRQNSADYHHTSHAPSHALSSHTGDEREDDPPPTKKARSEPADPIACSQCQKTLNEQEVTRVLGGSTAESVLCDDCLHSASQTLPQETSGKRKAARKRVRSDQAAPEPKRSRKQAKKSKQSSNRQGRPAAQRIRLENPELGAQSTPDTVEELEALQRHLAFEMNDKESEATKQLFEHVKSKNIKIKKSLYTLLAKVNRENLPTFCDKAAIFFGSLTTSIKDTGCLTSMLGNRKKHIRDFIEREDNELAYLAGLDTLRALSSMNNGKGLPDQATVKAMLNWAVWTVDGQFSMALFRALSSMNNGKGLPDQAKVKAMLDWAVWTVDGQFSMELFRALSSMNNGKGLPDEATVKAMLDWPVWKVDGQFSMELFRALSSMNSGKGLPDEATVKAMLDWAVWKVDGQFSMELFRALSSMNRSKGLPDQAKVKAMLDWPVWKVDGQFSMELFRALSSMNNGKGLPDQAKVKAMLDWAVWKVDGQFSMDLFRALSSMTHGKGLPDQATVKAMLDWAVWTVDGQFSMELFRALSSMNNGKGLPDQAKVKAMLDWAVWKVDGQFSMELFRALSSMNSSRGLPDEAKVKAMLDWAVWKVDGQFSMELFRALSSMNSSRGLPDEATVKAMLDWAIWQVGGQFSMELFRALSSMHKSRGLPDQAKVKAMLDWVVWKVDGQFSMELFRALSSMNSSRGLPDEATVKAMLDWAVWKVDGQFSMERFRALSSMNNGKGLPDQAKVKAMLDWLSYGGELNSSLQKLMGRLYVSEGMPDIKALKQYEQKLRNVFFADAVTGLESDDEDEQSCLIKQAALFLSTRKPRYGLNFEDVERFYQQVTGDASRKLEKITKAFNLLWRARCHSLPGSERSRQEHFTEHLRIAHTIATGDASDQ